MQQHCQDGIVTSFGPSRAELVHRAAVRTLRAAAAASIAGGSVPDMAAGQPHRASASGKPCS